jgi:outer membrane protein OmpA-like peptidoglycan-associated protein
MGTCKSKSGIIFVGAMLFVGCVLMLDALPAAAQAQPSEAQILEALKPKVSRAIGNTGANKSEHVKERRVIDALRNRPARSLTLTERTEIAEIAKTKPSIDLEINFDYNSDVVRPDARQPLQTLGRALSNEQMKGTVFFINGHTDAVGGFDFNQDLSERRAEAVKRILIQEFRLPADTLVAVGYGKTQLKNTTNPFAAENRRVQIVNTEQRTTARAPEY